LGAHSYRQWCYSVKARSWMAMIFGIGLAVRVTLILLTLHNAVYGGGPEPYQIALSLVRHGTYADVFGPGVGTTAHTSPALPILLAIVIRVAGVGLAGYLVQTTLAAMAASMAFALLPGLAVQCGLGMPVGVAAGFIGAITPINFWAQTSGYFDAPYTMLCVVGLCVLLGSAWSRASFPLRGAVSFGVLSGVSCLLNPAVLQVLFGWCLVGVARVGKNRMAFPKFMAVAAGLILLCLSPWAFRNFRTFGTPIWTRSNFGLELQVSNNDQATADLERNVRSPDFPHPFIQVREREKVRQIGELAYQEAKKEEAGFWIRNHPARFIQLVMERIFFFWFPPMLRWWQSAAEALITILAIAGLVSLFRKKHPSSWMFAAVLVFYPAVYSIIEVSPRYRLPIEPILFLLTGFFCSTLWSRTAGEAGETEEGARRANVSSAVASA
jgi:hypothetical protein